MSNEEEKIEFPSTYEYTAIGTLIGSIAVFFMTIFSFVFDPAVFLLDQAQDPASFTSTASAHHFEALVILVLDSIFIAGYISLFVGLWLLIRDFTELVGNIALGLGLLVGLGDIMENSLQFVLIHGVNNGWDPDPIIFAWVWILNILIDLCSYIAAIFFAIIHIRVWTPLSRKFLLGILLAFYAIIGMLSLLFPFLLFVRSVFFVIGLSIGTYVLFTEEDVELEELEELLFGKKKKQTSDFIR